ncbi:unnamed protein product, partial [marine sediment metagenome]
SELLKWGWKYVKDQIENINDIEADEAMDSILDGLSYTEPWERDNYCDICNESPCMCSDPGDPE